MQHSGVSCFFWTLLGWFVLGGWIIKCQRIKTTQEQNSIHLIAYWFFFLNLKKNWREFQIFWKNPENLKHKNCFWLKLNKLKLLHNRKCGSGSLYRKIISPKIFDRKGHLTETPFDRTPFDRMPFDRKYICPNRRLTESTFDRIAV
jgi:hypothetical protein